MNTLNLSIALARAEFKLKNEGSYLGLLWYLLNPLLVFFLLNFIFSRPLGGGIEHYPAYLLLGIIIFNFFRSATTEATKTVYEHRLILKSIAFPRQSLVGGVILKTLYSHLFEIIIFSLILLKNGIPLINLSYYFLILIFLIIFVYGLSLLFAALTVFFRDFEHIWNFASQLLWLATPIFYSLNDHPQLLLVNLFNPLFYFITLARDLMIPSRVVNPEILAGAIGYSFIFWWLGNAVFNRWQHKFAQMM